MIQPSEIATVDVRTTILPNGLTIVSERVVGAASLAIGLWVKVGSQDEFAVEAGVAHFIEHVVFKGTTNRSMRQIMRSVESKGGFLNAFTTKEHTCFYTWTRTAHLQQAVEVLTDLVINPVFSASEIDREKAVVIEEINGLEDEPDELIFDLFEENIFGNSPLGKPIIGTPKSIANLTRQRILKFHQECYRPSQMLLVATGSHEHQALIDAAIAAMPRRPNATSLRRRVPRRTRTRGVSELISPRSNGQQAHIILGRSAPGANSRDQIALSALITLLGVGMSSRLNLRLREELGLAYDATAFFTTYAKEGALGIYVATSVDNYSRALSEMRKIIHGLQTRPISAAELDRTKEQLIGSLLLPLESVSNRMMRTAQNKLYHDRYEPVERDIERITKLTLPEVRRVAERLLADDRALRLVALVPQSDGEAE